MYYSLRNAIEQRMHEIGEERRALADERKELFSMLRELEEGGDLIDPSFLVKELSSTVRTLKELVPNIPAPTFIEEMTKQHGHMLEDAKAAEPSPVTQAAAQQRILSPVKKKKRYNNKELASIVYQFAKHNGGTVSNDEIESYLLENYGLTYSSMSNCLWNLRAADKRLIKGGHGMTSIVDNDDEQQPTEELEDVNSL
jgi:hypothetical protein